MKRSLVPLISVALLGIGCAKPAEEIVGKWDIAPGSVPAPLPSLGLPPHSMAIEFRQDKTYHMGPQEGTYEINGRSVRMTPASMFGHENPKLSSMTVNLILSDDGKTLSKAAGGPIRLVKIK